MRSVSSILFITIVLLCIPALLAETFVVTTSDDAFIERDASMSLREAISLANNNGESDVIQFDAKVKKIKLVATLVITSDLTITGPVTLDGQGAVRLVKLRSASVQFQQLAFAKGFSVDNSDGGGAVFVDSASTASFENCIFDKNVAISGGAIQVDGTIEKIVVCTFTKNQAHKSGGAIDIRTNGSIALIQNSFFKSGSVIGDGAAISNAGNIDIIADSKFEKNVAGTSTEGSGGAIFDSGNIQEVLACLFLRNKASHRGGAYFDAGKGGQTLMCEVLFARNQTGNKEDNDDGGAIFAENGSDLLIQDCAFEKNDSWFNGGAIFTGGNLVIFNSKFAKNSSRDNNGGAIYLQTAATANIEHSLFERNEADDQGGAIYANTASALRCINSTYSRNRAHIDGGGHFDRGSNSSFLFCTFTCNKARWNGAGVYSLGGNVLLNSTLVQGNDSVNGCDLWGISFDRTSANNLIGEPGGWHGFSHGQNDNLVGVKAELREIRDERQTRVHSLKEKSPAINAGDPAQADIVVEDQRGFARTTDGTAPDIGASEYGVGDLAKEFKIVKRRATTSAQGTVIHWEVSQESEIVSFQVWRRLPDELQFRKIGTKNPTKGTKSYEFEDATVRSSDRGRCLYKVETVFSNGCRYFCKCIVAQSDIFAERIARYRK